MPRSQQYNMPVTINVANGDPATIRRILNDWGNNDLPRFLRAFNGKQ